MSWTSVSSGSAARESPPCLKDGFSTSAIRAGGHKGVAPRNNRVTALARYIRYTPGYPLLAGKVESHMGSSQIKVALRYPSLLGTAI